MAFLHVYGLLMAFCASEVCRDEFCFGGILLDAADQFGHFSSIILIYRRFSYVFLTY